MAVARRFDVTRALGDFPFDFLSFLLAQRSPAPSVTLFKFEPSDGDRRVRLPVSRFGDRNQPSVASRRKGRIRRELFRDGRLLALTSPRRRRFPPIFRELTSESPGR